MPPGRVLVIANHAGQLPFDGAMLQTALLLEAEPPRIVRAMGEYWIPQLPLVSFAAARGGAMVGTPHNCAQMLHHGECVAAFPEGVRGMNKLFRDRYQLQRFGLGFMRLALETHTPIVPVAIVGSEEQQPGFANLSGLARMLGMPAFPITLGFPWLGPARHAAAAGQVPDPLRRADLVRRKRRRGRRRDPGARRRGQARDLDDAATRGRGARGHLQLGSRECGWLPTSR
jgi:hypothetical protein